MGIKCVTLGPPYSHLKAEGMRIPRWQRGFLLHAFTFAECSVKESKLTSEPSKSTVTGQLCPARVCLGAGSAAAGWTGLVSLPGV